MKESTYAVYCSAVRRQLLPELGDRIAAKLGAEELEQFLNGKLQCGRLDGQGGSPPRR